MAGTTQYFGVSYPTATDYVKDGASAMQTIADGFDSAVAIPTYNNQTGTSYTFVLTDAGKTVTSDNASAVTFTIPPQSSVAWAANTTLTVRNLGAGVVTIAGGAGVTVTNTAQTVAQYGEVKLIRTASNAWTVVPASGGVAPVVNLASGTFTAVGAVNLSSVLSSTYKFYDLTVYAVCSAVEEFRLRFRENTTDVTSGYYQGSYFSPFTGSPGSYRPVNNGGYFNLGDIGTGQFVFNLKLTRSDATIGKITYQIVDAQNGGTCFAGGHRLSMTNFNGLSFYVGANNITGAYQLNGWN